MKDLLIQILEYINQFCYIFNDKDCNCKTRQNALIFKNRSGKIFQERELKKLCNVFGFEMRHARNCFDYMVYLEDHQAKKIVTEWIEKQIEITKPSSFTSLKEDYGLVV